MNPEETAAATAVLAALDQLDGALRESSGILAGLIDAQQQAIVALGEWRAVIGARLGGRGA